MSIPVRNIYYLLLYAWGHVEPGALQSVGEDDSPDLPNLLAKVLLESVNGILRRGLDRGYVGHEEATRSPRGRLLFNEMVKQQSLLRGVAICAVDELTVDVLHNQILRATLVRLANSPDVRRDLRHSLHGVSRRMVDVEPVRLTASVFQRVQLSRNTSHYRFALRVCELVFQMQLPDPKGTGTRFQNLLDDESRMPALFEDFLRNFYRLELDGYSSTAELMSWAATSASAADLELLPIMRTDITLRSSTQTIIADAKYYRDALSGGRYSPKIRSSHLYQLSTYLAHEELKDPERAVSGMLIYPSTGIRMRHRYNLLGRDVLVASVNLGADWPDIHEELIELIS